MKIYKGESYMYITLESLIAILGLCFTAYNIGYTVGSNNSKKHKK